jgi:hypothetical protein
MPNSYHMYNLIITVTGALTVTDSPHRLLSSDLAKHALYV